MTVRAAGQRRFPAGLCRRHSPPAPRKRQHRRHVTLPVPVANPQRILVLGDTGCRIKGAALQACNDPAQWPFPQLAAAAASTEARPGDPCRRLSLPRKRLSAPAMRAAPARPGATTGPPGRRISTPPPRRCWRPRPSCWCGAITKTAAAPVPAGQCCRAPAMRPAPVRCMSRFTRVDLGGLTLAVLDDAVSDETELDRDAWPRPMPMRSPAWRKSPTPVWLVHHRPTWAAITGPLGIPMGGNLTLMEASQPQRPARARRSFRLRWN